MSETVQDKNKPEEEKSDNVNEFKGAPVELSSPNKSFFEKMSDAGRKVASQIYEGLYKIPVVDRIIGKMEIAYSQFFIDRYEKKAVQLKGKIDGLDLRIKTLDQVKKKTESIIANFKKQNIPGVVESLQLNVRDIDRQIEGLLNNKDIIQSKFEERNNKKNLYTNERDRVADRLIENYEERLRPMNMELERLQTLNNQTDLLIVVTTARHEIKLSELSSTEKEMKEIEENFRSVGFSEEEIRNNEAIKKIKEELFIGREQIKTEKENLFRIKAETNRKIAKIAAKANPYEEKKSEFARVKKRRPQKINVEIRKEEVVFVGQEEIRTHRRANPEENQSLSSDETTEAQPDRDGENKEQLLVKNYIDSWNNFLTEKYQGGAEIVNLKDFLKATKLSEKDGFHFSHFREILKAYLKYRTLPTKQFNESIDEFYKQKKA